MAAPPGDPVQLTIAIATLFVACAAAVIAGLQWQAMRQAKWIQLFDRRYELYRQIGAAALECAQEGRVTDNAANVFREATHLGPLLFGEEYGWLFVKLWEAGYWKSTTLKPRHWPKDAIEGPAEPHALVSAAWKELGPELKSKLKRWN